MIRVEGRLKMVVALDKGGGLRRAVNGTVRYAGIYTSDRNAVGFERDTGLMMNCPRAIIITLIAISPGGEMRVSNPWERRAELPRVPTDSISLDSRQRLENVQA